VPELRSNPLAADLDLILSHTAGVFEELRGARIFITGGTGFFGTWLLESFCWANARRSLGAQAVVLTRDPDAFRAKARHLATDPALSFHTGDVRSFNFPGGAFSHVIHAATTSSAPQSALSILDTIIEGTRRTLDFAVQAGVKKLLLTSSGAVYGLQPAEITHTPETFGGSPDLMNPGSAYAEGKRVAELLCAIYHQEHHIEAKIARCFAFVGPGLPLNAHFAIGNFIRDSITGQPIRINGDGTPRRSYLYAADLMIWLWTILFQGQACRPYNVGSESDQSILTVAEKVAHALGGKSSIVVAEPASNRPEHRYVPATGRAREELHLCEYTSMEPAIQQTAAFAKLDRG
jgi:nucleoside-diphosphate-sugar epimerase